MTGKLRRHVARRRWRSMQFFQRRRASRDRGRGASGFPGRRRGIFGGSFQQIVQFVVAGIGVVDKFPVALADAEQEIVFSVAVEVGAVGVAGAKQAVALPGAGTVESEQIGDGGIDVQMAGNGFVAACRR